MSYGDGMGSFVIFVWVCGRGTTRVSAGLVVCSCAPGLPITWQRASSRHQQSFFGVRNQFAMMLLFATATAYQRPTITIAPNAGAAGDPTDWLLQPDPRLSPAVPTLVHLDDKTIALTNGLLARVFAIDPFFATWDVATSRGSAIRAVSEEATVTLDGTTYAVGGGIPLLDDGSGGACPLPRGIGPVNNCPTAYLNRSTPFGPNSSAFQFAGFWTSQPTAPFPWQQARHAPDMPWPPLGLRLNVNMTAPPDCAPAHKDVVVTISYEMYQGIPAMSKWLTVTHTGRRHHLGASRSTRTSPPAKPLGVPPDQQGPVCIQPCDQAAPPSNWESRWHVTPDVEGPIRLAGTASLCLSIVQGTPYHSFNDQCDVVACNASDPKQRWLLNSSSGLLLTRATPASILAAFDPKEKLPCGVPPSAPSSPPAVDTSHCSVDINNHQADKGTTVQMAANEGAAGARWQLQADALVVGPARLKAANSAYADRCLWHTPLPKPPPPPPPPPPKLPCAAPDCVVLTSAAVEVLRTNAPWSPNPPEFGSGDNR
jgi:hypothetical protein